MVATRDEMLGVLFIGVLVATALWGIACLQTYIYFNSYAKDPYYMKLLVVIVWMSETAHQVLVSHAVYFYTVSNFSNPSILDTMVWSMRSAAMPGFSTTLIVQMFFIFRIWKLSGSNYFLAGMIACLWLGQLAIFLVYLGKAYKGNFTTFTQFIPLEELDITAVVITTAIDVAIAAALTFLLYRLRTGFRRSDSTIKKLIVFAVNGGLLTSVNALASLVSVVASPETLIYFCFYFVMGRLYWNSLLATLNARNAIRDQMRHNSLFLQSVPMSTHLPNASGPSVQSTGDAVKVDTTPEHIRDLNFVQSAGLKVPLS